MKEIRIKVDNDMSKSKEIEIMQTLHNTFQELSNNYLSSLFTMNFITWVSNQIKNDLPPDAYVKRRLKESSDIIEGYDKRVEDLIEEKTKLSINANELATKLSISESQYEILLNETANTEDKLQKKIGCLENEIMILKAKLYDKITK